jgi:hypothetical protein
MREERDKLGKQTSFCARRELWIEGQGAWVTKYEVGSEESLNMLPSISNEKNGEPFAWERSCSEGDAIDVFGGRYIVRAISNVT